ncbi:MAG: hypothetical protein S4CHLAM6_09000 [Chlamydiae bacterium]|nr:hypothetical protein [Chlamydiota bacterium]
MSKPSICGLLETPYNFFIDHLAPLCSFLNIPILTSWPQTIFLYRRYYPNVEIKVKNWSVRYLLENYTSVLYSFVPEPSFRDVIKEQRAKNPDDEIWKKDLKLIHHFHGCSDKGYHSNWIKPDGHIKDVDLLLIYGERFKNLLEDKDLLHLPNEYQFVGNYRYTYYKKHKEYLDNLVQKEVFSQFEKKQKTILYAPTWADHEKSSSFLDIYKTLFETLPDDFNLIVKLHPNMTLKTPIYDPSPILKIIENYKDKLNVLILPFYPVVYPLINFCDIYLGDHSSVGYDVLAFNKPMFFLNVNKRKANDKGALLFKCGTVIEKEEFSCLYKIIVENLPLDTKLFQTSREQLYKDAFGENEAAASINL